MKKYAIISAFIIAIGIFLTPASNLAQDRRALTEAQRVTGDRFRVATTTPKGAKVFAVSKPSKAVLQAIDTGLTDLFAVARKNR